MLEYRRLAVLLMGSWLAGSLFMDATAINSFGAVDGFLSKPGNGGAALVIQEVGHEKARVLLRRVAGEANATLFERWNWIQLGLGAVVILIAVLGSRFKVGTPQLFTALVLLMLVIVLTSALLFTPNITRLSRVIDLLPAGETSPQRQLFGMYHGISSSLELLKLALGLAGAGLLLLERNRLPGSTDHG